MTYLPLEDLQPGMVLATNVTTSGGYLLLDSGTLITGRQLLMLKAHGIAGAEVAPISLDGPPGTGLELLPRADADALIAERFRHNDTSHPVIRELIRLYRKRAGLDRPIPAGETDER